MKKQLLAACLALSLIASPIANAELNYQNLSGTTLATAGALGAYMGLATGTAIAMTGGLALGLVGAAILIDNALSENSNRTNTAITIELNPNVPFTTPAGWTAATGTNKQPNPPGTIARTLYYSNVNVSYSSAPEYFHTTKEAACKFVADSQTPPGGSNTVKHDPATDSCTGNYYRADGSLAGTRNAVGYYPGQPPCPAGYTVTNTSTCTLQTASQVIKPKQGKTQIVRSGNTFVQDAQINPSDKLPSTVVNATSNKVTVNDQNGNTTTVEINADGTTTITRNTINGDGTSTSVKTKLSAPDSNGNTTVEGQSQEKLAGTGTQTTNNTNNYTSSGGGTGTPIDISSLNKESTQAQINTKLGDIKAQLQRDLYCDDCILPQDKTAEQKATIDAEIKKTTDSLEAITADQENFKGLDWADWIPEFPTGSCSPFTGQVLGHQITWDVCPYVAKINELIGWLMNIFAAWTITGMFFRRD